MDGMTMVMNRLLGMLGIAEEDLEMVKTALPQLRVQIPAFAAAVSEKISSMDLRLANIESKLDQLIAVHGEAITSQELPPAFDPAETSR